MNQYELAAQPPERPGPEGRPEREGPPGREGLLPPDGPGPPPERGRRGRPDGFRAPPNPLFEALDADGDRELSAEEIANATQALKSLDRNDDGVLSRTELRPRLPVPEDNPRRRPGPPEGDPELGRRAPPEGRNRDARDPRGARRPEGFDVERYVERIMKFDEDKDGKISGEELPDRMRDIVRRGDTDDDGFLSEPELRAVASSVPNRRGRSPRGGQRDRPDRPERPVLE